MAETTKNKITVGTQIKAPIEKVWQLWTDPNHIIRWYQASEDWHTTYAENNMMVGGRFLSRMEAKDGSHGFDMTGQYTLIAPQQAIHYVMDDGREVEITFTTDGEYTHVTETFDPETVNSLELQQAGWQAIMDSFKQHVASADRFVNLRFDIYINASTEKVYQTMLGEDTYKDWTAAFHPTSSYKGSWDKGSKIYFVAEEEGSQPGGMIAIIKENIPNKFVSIQHIGVFGGGKELYSGPEVDSWKDGLENYTFQGSQDGTMLIVQTDTNEEHKNYFEGAWPLALEKLKEICEQ